MKVIFERALVDQGLDGLLTEDRFDLAVDDPNSADVGRSVVRSW